MRLASRPIFKAPGILHKTAAACAFCRSLYLCEEEKVELTIKPLTSGVCLADSLYRKLLFLLQLILISTIERCKYNIELSELEKRQHGIV